MTLPSRRRRAAWRGLALAVPFFAATGLAAAPGECASATGQYEDDGYTVRRIRIDAPLAWLGPVRRDLNSIVEGLPIKERREAAGGHDAVKGLFTVDLFNAGFTAVQDGLGELRVNRTVRAAFQFGWSGLESCDPQDRSLEVVYHVYTAQFSPSFVNLFHRVEELGRAPVEDRFTKALAAIGPQPYWGYNRSRNTYAGIRLTPPARGPFHSSLVDVSGSSTSLLIRAGLVGSREFGASRLQKLEWRAGYLHSDMPASTLRLREGALRGQLFGSTRPVGRTELATRFGASLEGGNLQTDLAASPPGRFDLPSTGFGTLKTYFGQSMRAGPLWLRNSYGVQFGKAGDSFRIGYRKHLVDSVHSARFLIAGHRTISIESRFSAGLLNAGRGAPVAERFFGGNVVRPYIDGDPWNIAADPLIRSFPQNRLALTPLGGAGGDRFFSGTLTVAATAWQIPLVPAEALSDPQLMDFIDFQLGVAETSLASEYRGKAGDAVEMAEHAASGLTEDLKILERAPGADTALQACKADVKRINDKLEAIGAKLKDGAADLTAIRTIAALPDTTPLKTSYLTKLQSSCGKAEALLAGEEASRFKAARERLAASQNKLRTEFKAAEASPAATRFADQATKDMLYPRRVIKELLREVNLIDVSPVAIFDAARAWRGGLRAGDVRYAAGGGLRFSLVNLDLTAGYAWTIGSRPGEGRGALLLTVGVSNLFR